MSEPKTYQALAAQPVYFGQQGETLFGWYHPPAIRDGQTRDCVVVMCNPIGYEAICTHRHYRILAQRLASAGFAVLRYDHHGTGDSAGGDEDPERLRAWVDGVATAVKFAKTTSGASVASLFGVRMGGTIALAAATARDKLAESLVAWAAFPSGRNYLREVRALRMLREANAKMPPITSDAGVDVGEEVAGYLLTTSTIAELDALNLLDSTAASITSVLILARDDIPQSEKLAVHLSKVGCEVTSLKPHGYAGMIRDTFDAIVPTNALTQIVDWLAKRHTLRFSIATQNAVSINQILLRGDGREEGQVTETPIHFGPSSQLFGIVSSPAYPRGDRERTAVVFVSVGSNLHIGPNRMYVTQARAIASLGFLAMRMDIGGVGESPPRSGHLENHLYGLHSIDDIAAAIRFLRNNKNVSKIVLVGLCSGAYLAFHTAIIEQGIASVILINPQTFAWRDGDSLQLKMAHGLKSLMHYRERMFTSKTWIRLVGGKVDIRSISSGIIRLILKRVALKLKRLAKVSKSKESFDVKDQFKTLLKQGVAVILLYSANDGGLSEMGTHLGRHASSLRRSRNFQFEVIDGADHTFTPLWAQRQLLDLLIQHAIQRYG